MTNNKLLNVSCGVVALLTMTILAWSPTPAEAADAIALDIVNSTNKTTTFTIRPGSTYRGSQFNWPRSALTVGAGKSTTIHLTLAPSAGHDVAAPYFSIIPSTQGGEPQRFKFDEAGQLLLRNSPNGYRGTLYNASYATMNSAGQWNYKSRLAADRGRTWVFEEKDEDVVHAKTYRVQHAVGSQHLRASSHRAKQYRRNDDGFKWVFIPVRDWPFAQPNYYYVMNLRTGSVLTDTDTPGGIIDVIRHEDRGNGGMTPAQLSRDGRQSRKVAVQQWEVHWQPGNKRIRLRNKETRAWLNRAPHNRCVDGGGQNAKHLDWVVEQTGTADLAVLVVTQIKCVKPSTGVDANTKILFQAIDAAVDAAAAVATGGTSAAASAAGKAVARKAAQTAFKSGIKTGFKAGVEAIGKRGIKTTVREATESSVKKAITKAAQKAGMGRFKGQAAGRFGKIGSKIGFESAEEAAEKAAKEAAKVAAMNARQKAWHTTKKAVKKAVKEGVQTAATAKAEQVARAEIVTWDGVQAWYKAAGRGGINALKDSDSLSEAIFGAFGGKDVADDFYMKLNGVPRWPNGGNATRDYHWNAGKGRSTPVFCTHIFKRSKGCLIEFMEHDSGSNDDSLQKVFHDTSDLTDWIEVRDRVIEHRGEGSLYLITYHIRPFGVWQYDSDNEPIGISMPLEPVKPSNLPVGSLARVLANTDYIFRHYIGEMMMSWNWQFLEDGTVKCRVAPGLRWSVLNREAGQVELLLANGEKRTLTFDASFEKFTFSANLPNLEFCQGHPKFMHDWQDDWQKGTPTPDIIEKFVFELGHGSPAAKEGWTRLKDRAMQHHYANAEFYLADTTWMTGDYEFTLAKGGAVTNTEHNRSRLLEGYWWRNLDPHVQLYHRTKKPLMLKFDNSLTSFQTSEFDGRLVSGHPLLQKLVTSIKWTTKMDGDTSGRYNEYTFLPDGTLLGTDLTGKWRWILVDPRSIRMYQGLKKMLIVKFERDLSSFFIELSPQHTLRGRPKGGTLPLLTKKAKAEAARKKMYSDQLSNKITKKIWNYTYRGQVSELVFGEAGDIQRYEAWRGYRWKTIGLKQVEATLGTTNIGSFVLEFGGSQLDRFVRTYPDGSTGVGTLHKEIRKVFELERVLAGTTWIMSVGGAKFDLTFQKPDADGAAMISDNIGFLKNTGWSVIGDRLVHLYNQDPTEPASMNLKFEANMKSFSFKRPDGMMITGRPKPSAASPSKPVAQPGSETLRSALAGKTWTMKEEGPEKELIFAKSGDVQGDKMFKGLRWRAISAKVAELYAVDGSKIALLFDDRLTTFVYRAADGQTLTGRPKTGGTPGGTSPTPLSTNPGTAAGNAQLIRALANSTWLYSHQGTDYEFTLGRGGSFRSAIMQFSPSWQGVQWRVVGPKEAELYRAGGAKISLRFNDPPHAFAATDWDGTPVTGRMKSGTGAGTGTSAPTKASGMKRLSGALADSTWLYSHQGTDYEFTLGRGGSFRSAIMQFSPSWQGVQWRVVGPKEAELYRAGGAKISLRFNDPPHAFAATDWDGTPVTGRVKR